MSETWEAWEALELPRIPADKLEAEMLETLVNVLLRHPTLISWLPRKPRRATFAMPSPMAMLSPNMQSLARCLQANYASIKNWWVSNLSCRKKLAQNQMFTWNVSSIAPSKNLPSASFHKPLSITWALAAIKKEHFWPTYSMLFFT